MNFRRGFFRAWIVVTAIWVALVVTMNWVEVSESFEAQAKFKSFNDLGELMLPFKCTGIIKNSGRTKNGLGENVCWVGTTRYFELHPNENFFSQFDPNFLERVYRSAGIPMPTHPRPWEKVNFAAMVALIPAAILLILGLMLFWIASGFRRNVSLD